MPGFPHGFRFLGIWRQNHTLVDLVKGLDMQAKQVSGFTHFALQLRLVFRIIRISFRFTSHPVKAALYALRFINTMPIKVHSPLRCSFKMNGRSYWDLNVPGFPSPAFDRVLEKEIAMFHGSPVSPLILGIVAMTRKCGLNCEHCFEWDSINRKEQLKMPELESIIEKLVGLEVGQIILSGGDPLNRFPVLVSLLETYRDKPVEFWINTSGYLLSQEKASRLKEAGLRGIVFSLDHFVPELHDKFRGVSGSFDHVVSGARFAENAGLVTALSLCATKAFISEASLRQYTDLARSLRIRFVQILEPKAAGRYAGTEARLNTGEVEILERFYEGYIRKGKGPILSYPDYNKRRFGCIAGKKYIYVDTEGRFKPCPFCSGEPGNEFCSGAVEKMRESCHSSLMPAAIINA